MFETSFFFRQKVALNNTPDGVFKVKRYRCYCAIGMHMLTGAVLGRVLPFPSSMSRWSDQTNYRRQCRLCFTM